MATIFIIHKSNQHMAIVVTSYEYTDISYSQLHVAYIPSLPLLVARHIQLPAQHYVSGYEYLKLLT